MSEDDAALKKEFAGLPISRPALTMLNSILIVIVRMDSESGINAGQDFLQVLRRQTEVTLERAQPQDLSDNEKEDVRRFLRLVDHLLSRFVSEYSVYDAEDEIASSESN